MRNVIRALANIMIVGGIVLLALTVIRALELLQVLH